MGTKSKKTTEQQAINTEFEHMTINLKNKARLGQELIKLAKAFRLQNNTQIKHFVKNTGLDIKINTVFPKQEIESLINEATSLAQVQDFPTLFTDTLLEAMTAQLNPDQNTQPKEA